MGKETAAPAATWTGRESLARRVLVVDDNPAVLENVVRVLSRPVGNRALDSLEAELFGTGGGGSPVEEPPVEVDTAVQGEEGYAQVVKAVAEGRPCLLVVVDMRMPPGWDGVETLQRMLEADPELEVAVCTAFSDYTRAEVERTVGREDLAWLPKPFNGQQLRDLVRQLTDRGLERRSRSAPSEGGPRG